MVDNGPAEQPCSPLVKMCLARLLRFMKLDRICQISFAEYHSERNFVEMPRRIGFYQLMACNAMHKQATKEHKENMEHMAEEMRKCLIQGSYSPLMCFRGLKEEEQLFVDDEEVQSFIGLSEEGKLMFSPQTYSGVRSLTTFGSLIESTREATSQNTKPLTMTYRQENCLDRQVYNCLVLRFIYTHKI